MDIPLPNINSFSPQTLTSKELDSLIDTQYTKFASLYDNEREYNIDLSRMLNDAINHRKMVIWTRNIENELFKPRNVTITFNESQNYFNIFANDTLPVLIGYPIEAIKNKNWFYASDGHSGIHAIVIAPKDSKEELELIFKAPAKHIQGSVHN